MKLFNKIRAIFRFRGERAEVDVSAAEVKKGKVYLHPIDDPEHIYCILSDDVQISISPNKDITEDDLEIIEKPKKSEKEKQEEKEKSAKERKSRSSNGGHGDNPYKMRKMTITMYPDEYDALMENISSNRYRKTEFLLACVDCAKKNSMEATYKRYTQEHRRRKAEARMAMKEAKEE